MKKVICLLLSLAMLISLCACAEKTPIIIDDKTDDISVSNKNNVDLLDYNIMNNEDIIDEKISNTVGNFEATKVNISGSSSAVTNNVNKLNSTYENITSSVKISDIVVKNDGEVTEKNSNISNDNLEYTLCDDPGCEDFDIVWDISDQVIENFTDYKVDDSKDSKTTTIKFTFAGDCMLASYKGQVGAGNFADTALKGNWEYFLDGVDEYFEDDDFTVVNLENVLTDDNSLKPVAKDHNPAYWFKGPTANTQILTSQSVEIANLANNHFGDYGTKGRSDTIKACEDAGLLWGNNDKTVYVEKNGIKVALIFHGLWYEGQEQTIINRINEASKQSDLQIVYFHGGKEGTHTPEKWKMRAVHRIVDAGADLVIGNHPHVLQPYEIYNGVGIVYSMGNFCYGGSKKPENRTIIYKFNVTFDNETGNLISKSAKIIPCYVYTGTSNNWQPKVIEDAAVKQKVLDFMAWATNTPV